MNLSELLFWRNPIFIRYCRAKLRPVSLISWSLIVLILTGFVFTLVYLLPQRSDVMTREEAARLTIIPLFIIQCFILMFKGSFSVASGITREGMEGVLDYQRLTPMSSFGKIIGYLFGLPVLDYVLFLLTLPFLIFTVVVGNVSLDILFRLYSVFFTSVLLYHMTGFMAGMVVSKRFLAGFISQTLMIGLYFILPSFSRLGYVFFEYLTVRPVVYYELSQLLPEEFERYVKLDTVNFFNLNFSVVSFSIVIQALLFFVFFMIVLRKWKQDSHHLLGKHFSVITYAGIIIALMGSMLPLINNGRIFPSQSARRFFEVDPTSYISPNEALLIPGLFGIVTLLLAIVIIGQMTPSFDKQMKGQRRVHKLNENRVDPGDDESTSIFHTIAIIGIAVISWNVFIGYLFESRWYEGWVLSKYSWIGTVLSLGLPILIYQMLLEFGGRRLAFISLLLGWLLPLFVGVLMMIATDSLVNAGTYILMLSGFAFPYFSVEAALTVNDTFVVNFPEAKKAFMHVAIIYATLFPLLFMKWRQHHVELNKKKKEVL